MKLNNVFVIAGLAGLMACGGGDASKDTDVSKSQMKIVRPDDEQPYAAPNPVQVIDEAGFVWQTEQFADLKTIRYQVPGWDKLTAKQKELVYYLTQAGLAGRDIMWDQNYRHNLEIRDLLEKIYTEYRGDKETVGWNRFETYLKRVWFSNGIHHHYANGKFKPEFSMGYFKKLCDNAGVNPSEEMLMVIFNPHIDPKKVELDPDKGLLENSAVNFYAPEITTQEAKDYYATKIDKTTRTPISYGLNSRLEKDANGNIVENVWSAKGMYAPAIKEIISWLEKAEKVAENEKQAAALRKLVKYYQTGDLREWDNYNILWVSATEGDIDYINGFVEVYNDPLGYRGSYETVVQIKDFDASARMDVMMENIQWFEDNSPLMPEHKKESVVGVTYKVVNVAGEAGDASPSTPIGVNLPNANWIRVKNGSKSVSLGNIVNAYDQASGEGMLTEFAYDEEEIALAKKHGVLAGKLHTALHEVVGHASGQIEDGVGSPAETLQNYSSTLEEGRADLVALYYLMDPKLIEMGLMETLDVGKAEYDSYIRNGMLTQLFRIEAGNNIEEAHMRNRAWVSHWVFEKGASKNVISRIEKDGKTYYNINDYDALRVLFGELLKEVQRIKSQGDYAAGKALVETYGVKVDPKVHQEVLERAGKLGIPPYGGFINPVLVPKMEGNKMVDVELTYMDSFSEQMLFYSKNYHHLK